jgi:dipeptidyl aminopeptidase/acylaminoacyl peptidase
MKQPANIIVFILIVLSFGHIYAQKKPVDLHSLDQWEGFTERRISRNGEWVSFGVSPSDPAQRTLHLKGMVNRRYFLFKGANNGRFSSDSKWYTFTQPAQKAGLPDTTVVVNLLDGQQEKFSAITAFAWADSNSAVRTWFSGAKEQQQLVIASAEGNILMEQKGVQRYILLPHGEGVFYTVKDATGLKLIFTDLAQQRTDTLLKGCTDLGVFSYDVASRRLAFPLTDHHITRLMLYDANTRKMMTLPIESKQSDTGYVLTAQSRVVFLKQTPWLLYSTQYNYPERAQPPIAGEAKVEVWSHSDKELYSKQKRGLVNTLNKQYYFSYNTVTGSRIQLTSIDADEWQLPGQGSTENILVSTSIPYLAQKQWDPVTRRDAFLINLHTGVRKVIARNTAAEFALSPFGQYVVWFDREKQHYYTYQTNSGVTRQIDKGVKDGLVDTSLNLPQAPEPYGIASWEEQDRSLLLTTDRDVWRVDPSGQKGTENITASTTRKNLRYSYYGNWQLASYFTPSDTLLFFAVDRKTKDAGFFAVSMRAKERVKPLLFGPYSFSYPGMDIANNRQVLFSFGNTAFYGLFYSKDLRHFDTLHVLNPQRKEYNWYKTELVRWQVRKGVYTEGYLYKPENFDPSQKYPLLIWLYENGYAQNVNDHVTPQWSYSFINFGFYASNGYVVFVPDVQYQIGKPGESAYESVMTGVKHLQKQGWLDTARMGLQGHSWGGYEVAYILTRTSIFKAASAGAVVANMTSAYGGVRTNYGGESRQWIYEKHQSRLGASLWQNQSLYIQNSPLFLADKISTPLLLMHNEQDGGVPFSQGVEFFSALRRLNKTAWLLNYPDENHVLRNPINKKDFTYRLYQFFEHYLKGKPAPSWMLKGIPAIEEGYTKGY